MHILDNYYIFCNLFLIFLFSRWTFCSAWESRGFELGLISSYKFRCRLLVVDMASQKLHNESE